MALPFGLGAAVSLGLYHLQNDPSVPFGSFVLFLGVAIAITAFPVLARILAELKLLGTDVGVITMGAGLLNDCTAWILLALVVALLNSTGGIVALYVFLTLLGFALFLIFVIKPLYYKLCVYTGSFDNGPTPLLMTVTLLMVLAAAFVTSIIGVHPIFGGALAGIVIPREANLPIRITEKIEDVVNIVFLPLYFTLSGLKTQIGLLDSGVVWGYVFLTIFVACFGKITGCTLAARFTGMKWRQSLAVGFLMNCKGLVELIVLNIGHDAGVLNDQVFVILVVMALITTFMTTPTVIKVLGSDYHLRHPIIRKEDETPTTIDSDDKASVKGLEESHFSTADASLAIAMASDRFTLVTVLNRLETVPSVMALIRLLKRDDDNLKTSPHIHAVRLLELTQRPSDVMKIQDIKETQRRDPVLSVIRTFSSLIGIRLTTSMDFAAVHDFARRVGDAASSVDADMVLLPWQPNSLSTDKHRTDGFPFETPTASSAYQLPDAEFATHAFALDNVSVGLFLDRGFGQIRDGDNVQLQHATAVKVIVPFLGGKDDRLAVLFALRMQVYRHATVIVLRHRPSASSSASGDQDIKNLPQYATPQAIKTYLSPSVGMATLEDNNAFLDGLFDVSNQETNVVLQSVEDMSAHGVIHSQDTPLGKHDIIVLGRRKELAPHTSTLATPLGTPGTVYSKEFKVALGALAFDLISSSVNSSLLVMQATHPSQKA
ncbi:Sodium/hydrogen exchanger family-domain-containing protein [Gongronella butleri]|nr:Sodium/hydrogen exchanger family-domain-containing protein [Gongronella butleri]